MKYGTKYVDNRCIMQWTRHNASEIVLVRIPQDRILSFYTPMYGEQDL